MKRLSHHFLTAGFALAILTFYSNVWADDTAVAGLQPAPYNFAWKVSGAAAAAPIQVFDSGSRILLQFPDPSRIPVILADAPGGQILLEWHQEMPYVVINHLETRLVFHRGTAVAYAQRIDSSGAPQGVETGSVAPVVVTGSALSPVSHAQLVSNRRSADANVSDHSVLRDSSVQSNAGIAGQEQSSVAGFDLRIEDKSIDRALQRWAQQSGWTVDWVSTIAPPNER